MKKTPQKPMFVNNETIIERKTRIEQIIKTLRIEYPDAKCSLDFKTPHQLMVAAILAAQCTDVRVNIVTPDLFNKYKTIEDFANADYDELESLVKSTGFFRNKTKSIIESARQIVTNFNGIVPESMEDLTSLSGVGRKTANLIIGDAYEKPAVIVDTHVRRISGRLGLTESTDPDKIEFDLRNILADDISTSFNHLIVAHGRAVCKAPTPLCERCVINSFCPTGGTLLENN